MKIYGAGSPDDIKKCTELGCDGILTNPDGFERYYGGNFTLEEITKIIINATDLPVFIQIHGGTTEDIINKAYHLSSLAPERVGFKILSDEKGFKAIKALQKQGIKCIATALFSISQAAIAAMVGAYGICPFISRAREIGMNPFEILKAIKESYKGLKTPPEIIAVSIKCIGDVEAAISAGADAIGIRYSLIADMMKHPLTSKAEYLFAKNWAGVKGEDISYILNNNARE